MVDLLLHRLQHLQPRIHEANRDERGQGLFLRGVYKAYNITALLSQEEADRAVCDLFFSIMESRRSMYKSGFCIYSVCPCPKSHNTLPLGRCFENYSIGYFTACLRDTNHISEHILILLPRGNVTMQCDLSSSQLEARAELDHGLIGRRYRSIEAERTLPSLLTTGGILQRRSWDDNRCSRDLMSILDRSLSVLVEIRNSQHSKIRGTAVKLDPQLLHDQQPSHIALRSARA